MPRVPILSGSRVVVVNAPEDAVVLRPPAPPEAIADVGAAVRDALRFPLSGEPLEALVPRGGRVTVVVEPPALPLPGARVDPRQEALAAVIEELRRLGAGTDRITILLAGGLARRARQRELEDLLAPDQARRFRGAVEVHDAEAPDLVGLGEADGVPLRASSALVHADAVVAVSAAETVLHGGAAVLLGAGGPEALRAATADSLLETAGAPGFELALAFERALAQRVPVIGASLALNHPRLAGGFRGYPYEARSLEQVARSPLRRAFSLLPAAVRRRVLQRLPREITAAAAFAGAPSVAHAEALLRGIALRGVRLEQPVDALVVGVPWKAPHLPREPVNPIVAATLGLGLALRLWRDAFPVAEGGTAILVHRVSRRFHPTQAPYRTLFEALRDREDVDALERSVARDERMLDAYRAGRACHPLLPFADWASCAPVLRRVGAVVVAGSRDAVAARALGFVPTHGIAPALAMAHGRAGGRARVGVLLSPPYFPVEVGAS